MEYDLPKVMVYDWLLVQAIVMSRRKFQLPTAAVNVETLNFRAA
jgi:hypothetical protein